MEGHYSKESLVNVLSVKGSKMDSWLCSFIVAIAKIFTLTFFLKGNMEIKGAI